MDTLNQFIADQLTDLFPHYEALEVRGWVDEKSEGMEFFVTRNGERKQCYDMVDRGELNENQVDAIIQAIAQFTRTLPDYVQGKVYSMDVVITSDK